MQRTTAEVDIQGSGGVLRCGVRVSSVVGMNWKQQYTWTGTVIIVCCSGSRARNIPVMVCVGSVSTDAILHLADDAQAAGADALLLPAVSYQSLRR